MAMHKDTDLYQGLLGVLSVLDDKIDNTTLPASIKEHLHGKNRALTSEILSTYTKHKKDALAYPGMAVSEAKLKQQEHLLAMHVDDIQFLDQLIEDALEEQREAIKRRNERQDYLNAEIAKDDAQAQEFVEKVAALRPDLADLQNQLNALYGQWNASWNQIAAHLGVGNISTQQRHNIHHRYQYYSQNAAQYLPMARAALWATPDMGETELLANLALREVLAPEAFTSEEEVRNASHLVVSSNPLLQRINGLEEQIIYSSGISVNIAGQDLENINSFTYETGGIYADVEHAARLAEYNVEKTNLLKAYKHSNPNAQVMPENAEEILAKAHAAMKQYERSKFREITRQGLAGVLDQATPAAPQGASSFGPPPGQSIPSSQLNTPPVASTVDTIDAEEVPEGPNASASTSAANAAPASQEPASGSDLAVTMDFDDSQFAGEFDDDFGDDMDDGSNDDEDLAPHSPGRLAQRNEQSQVMPGNGSGRSLD